MKVLLVTPPFPSTARGNAVTVERWRVNLIRRGVAVTKVAPDEVAACRREEHPDVLHAHHAVHTGRAALAACRDGEPPALVVSLGGTDLNGGPGGAPDPEALEVLRRAALVLGPDASAGERLAAGCPDAAPYRTVRRGVTVPEAMAPPPDRSGLIGLVVGGVRPVKGQLEAAALATALRRCGLDVALRFVGPAVDADYAARLAARLDRQAADRWTGEAAPDTMADHYANADFVLNTSHHEGASNALLEAMAAGRPVAARDVAGNRSLLAAAPDRAACLFAVNGDGGELVAWLTRLAGERRAARTARGEAARAFVQRRHDVEIETDELIAAYRTARGV